MIKTGNKLVLEVSNQRFYQIDLRNLKVGERYDIFLPYLLVIPEMTSETNLSVRNGDARSFDNCELAKIMIDRISHIPFREHVYTKVSFTDCKIPK